jgi:predicted glutamine amidotransferase
MCGIVGLVTKQTNGLHKQTEDSFFQMLYADALRGDDSTGIIAVEKDTTFHIAKEAVAADWFISSLKGYTEHKQQIIAPMYACGKAYIGHNRKKTIGKISDETAHPFVVEKTFAMVHNGTLHNHRDLAKTEVDSEALAIHLQKAIAAGGKELKDVKEKLEEALGKVYGAYAIAAYDQVYHRVYLLRNKDRPLSICETDNAYYFMSEALMGAWILPRNNYKYADLKFHHLLEHQLAVIDLDTNKMVLEQLVPKRLGYSSTPAQNSTSHHGSTTATRTTTNATSGKTGKPMTTEKELKKFRKDWLGKRVSFWADDYFEKAYPRTIEQGETEVVLLAQLEEVDWWHTVLADIDMGKLGLRYKEDLFDNKWSGLIEGCTLLPSGVLQIHLEDGSIKPFLKAPTLKLDDLRVQKAWKENLGFKNRETLAVMYEETKHTAPTWQVSAISGEIAFRDGIKTMEQAQAVCKEKSNGDILTMKHYGDNIWLYTDSMGRIYYEVTTTLH